MKYDQGIKNGEVVVLEVCGQELAKMVEVDYQHRLAEATEDERVLKRTVQEIVEEWNRLEYNSWRTHNRRKVFVQKEGDGSTDLNLLDMIADDSQEKERQKKADYDEMCQKVRQALKPDQAEMIIAICLDGMTVKDYAHSINENLAGTYKKFQRTKKKIKRNFQKVSNFPLSRGYK